MILSKASPKRCVPQDILYPPSAGAADHIKVVAWKWLGIEALNDLELLHAVL